MELRGRGPSQECFEHFRSALNEADDFWREPVGTIYPRCSRARRQAGEFENSAARNFSALVIRKSEGNARKNTERLVPELGTGRSDG